jgi:hypothetical protein
MIAKTFLTQQISDIQRETYVAAALTVGSIRTSLVTASSGVRINTNIENTAAGHGCATGRRTILFLTLDRFVWRQLQPECRKERGRPRCMNTLSSDHFNG